MSFSSCHTVRCDAYKHIPVAREDRALQIFRVGDRFFCDKNLSFGGSTSPYLYDFPAELVTRMAHWEASVDRRKSLRQLDDLVGVGTYEEVSALYDATREVCAYIGVRLAPETDPDKAFPPCKEGTILGITYSIPSWEWKLAKDKSDRLTELLFEVIQQDTIKNGVLKKLLGN